MGFWGLWVYRFYREPKGKKRKTRGDKGRYLEMLVDFGRLNHTIPRPYFKNADRLRLMASPRGATAPKNHSLLKNAL